MSQVHFASLDLNLLRIFDALMEERSVTRVAERLRLTQSAISHALNRLRHVLGDELFRRTSEGMQPTARAADLGPRVRHALRQMERALAPTAFDPATTDRCFTLATADSTAALLLPALVPALRAEAPSAELRIRPIDEIDIADMLDGGRLDLAVGSFRRVPERFAHEPLYGDEMVWLMRAGHPAARRPLTLERIAALPHLAIAPTGHGAEAIDGIVSRHGLERRVIAHGCVPLDQALAAKGLSRQIQVTVPHFLAVPRLLVGTDMITLVPRRLATGFAAHFPLLIRELPCDRARFEVSMLWHARLGERTEIAWLRALLLRVAADVDAPEAARRKRA